MRHGMSVLNEQRIHQQSSTPLSDKGLLQATLLAERFRTIPVDVVLSSHYRRAQHTAEIIAEAMGKTVEISPILHEAKRPTILQGKRYDDPESLSIRALIQEKSNDPDWHYSDEENITDCQKRAQEFLRLLDGRQEENILAVTHSTFLHMIIAVMLYDGEVDPAIFSKHLSFYIAANTGVTICEKEKGGSWKLLTWSDQAHLGE